MQIDLGEKDIIYILNCISYTINVFKFHSLEEKKKLLVYYNFDNFYEDYNSMILLHRLISTKANRELYNIINDNFFKGQQDYLSSQEKNFLFLKLNKKVVENKKTNFLNIFKFNIDKRKNIV